jgi:hypothetical protein
MGNPTGNEFNGKTDVLAPESALQRIAELEAENLSLREEIVKLCRRSIAEEALREAYLMEGMPRDEEEYQEMVANARPVRNLIAELERELRLDRTP